MIDDAIRRLMAYHGIRMVNQAIYDDTWTKDYEQPGYVYNYHWQDQFVPPTASELEIEGKCREIGLMGLPGDEVKL